MQCHFSNHIFSLLGAAVSIRIVDQLQKGCFEAWIYPNALVCTGETDKTHGFQSVPDLGLK